MASAPLGDHLLQEVKLASSSRERQKIDSMANVFAIVQTLEQLERAYAHDSVGGEEYKAACNKLISQYKAGLDILPVELRGNMETFFKDYRLECRSARHRLKVGVSALDEYGGGRQMDQSERRLVVKVTGAFITVMDALSMEQRAVDQLHPNLADLNSNLNQITSLPSDHEAKVTVRRWLEKLHSMRASDELDEEQSRQMLFDLETAMGQFEQAL